MLEAPAPRAELADLAPAELRVLGLMAEGLANPAIAELLVVSPRTVEHHVRSIFLKLGLRYVTGTDRRVAAVLIYLAAGEDAWPPASVPALMTAPGTPHTVALTG